MLKDTKENEMLKGSLLTSRRRMVFATIMFLAIIMAVVFISSRKPPHPRLSLPVAGKLEISGVTIVDPADGSLSPNMTVRMDGGRIVAVQTADRIAPDASFPKIAAAGKFLVPGYNDMHHHALNNYDPSAVLALMLADGVTGFRQMSGAAKLTGSELAAERREGRLAIGEDAPAVLQLPGAVLIPVNAASAEEVTKEIDRQKKDGVDFIKVGLLAPDVFWAALAEAKRVNLPILGHLQAGVDPAEAARRGFRSIEHLGPRDPLLFACSAQEKTLFEEATHDLLIKPPTFKYPFYYEIAIWRVISDPEGLTKPGYISRIQRAMDSFDEQKCRRLANLFKATDTWNVPTLISVPENENRDEAMVMSDPAIQYMSDKEIAKARKDARARAALSSNAIRAVRNEFVEHLRMVKIFDQVGAPMMTGTDAGHIKPNGSLHQQFDTLASAGISPLHILQQTTINPARYLGRTQTMGSVAVGKNADLVLLDGNPLESAANLHKIVGVVRAGRYYSASDLEALREKVRRERNTR